MKYGKTIQNVPLKDYTTYKLSGTIREVIYPDTIDDLSNLLNYLRKNKIKHMVIGNGSNLIFVNDYDGTIVKLDRLDNLIINDTKVIVGAGYNLMKLALKTANIGLSGLEFASGIPATVGGAIYMNAGAYNHEISEVVKTVTVINEEGNIQTLNKEELSFNYRSSILKNKDFICIEATLELQKGNKNAILNIIKDLKKRRYESQPLEYPSAGSVFRNPDTKIVGKLIDDLGLKGYQVGGAKVSEKHANFIVSDGTASGKDIKDLIDVIKEKIKEEYNIDLIIEQEIIE